jgi:hypothetical protein
MCVDIDGGVPMNGNRIQITACNGTIAQVWTALTDGSLRVVGYCLRIAGNQTAAGTPVESWTCDGSAAQRWTLADNRIVNPGTGLCLAAPSGADRTELVVAVCNGSAGQTWTLPPLV